MFILHSFYESFVDARNVYSYTLLVWYTQKHDILEKDYIENRLHYVKLQGNVQQHIGFKCFRYNVNILYNFHVYGLFACSFYRNGKVTKKKTYFPLNNIHLKIPVFHQSFTFV